MPNVNSPYGLRPYRHKSGAEPILNEYTIADDYATAIFLGDVVEMTGTGKNIAKAAAGNADNIGVFAGVQFVTADGEVQYRKTWPTPTGATNIKALVYDDPAIQFRAQADTLAEGDVGALADWNVGTGNTATGLSGLYVDITATTATSGKSLRIVGLVPDGQVYGAFADVIVEFAEHALIPGGGVGV